MFMRFNFIEVSTLRNFLTPKFSQSTVAFIDIVKPKPSTSIQIHRVLEIMIRHQTKFDIHLNIFWF